MTRHQLAQVAAEFCASPEDDEPNVASTLSAEGK